MTTLPTTLRKTALITGASSGIGKALAFEFAKDGYDVVLAARSIEKMKSLANELHSHFKVNVIVISADLEINGGATTLHADIKARGIRLNALVNNAGYGTFGEFKNSSLTAELSMMKLNMEAVVALTRLCLPDLLATKGKLLNVASLQHFSRVPIWRFTALQNRLF